ncbi:IclR family transcriptional regulator [Acuticoccus sediminis]|uniref:IclR family transcriptional regulator n=1 Tax=Acuticoccus sediminis TaxID=2184697 RepID=A0A8B2NS62_9HYPH|nr:IclR family transcriptional regulator [Acuticoccus sediminis]RAH98222.1 IclR family transcriptional regulator [Acuticoccus sediminis]
MTSSAPDDLESTDENDRSFVTALARGLDVLRCFRPNETTLTNQDIAARTGLPKPTVTRLTYTLRRLGYLAHSERTGTYRLSAGVLSLGYGVLAGMEIGDRAQAELRRLVDEGSNPHVTAALAERHRLSAVYMAVARARHTVSMTMNVGARLPLFSSAIGRAILAGMPEQEREHIVLLARSEMPDRIHEIETGVEAAVTSYQKHGFCTAFADWRPEVNGIAVPIISLNGDRIYGLNVGGPSFLVSPECLAEEYGDRLKSSCEVLSQPARPAAS